MMSEEMTCKQGPTLKPILTYVATVQWLIIATMKLKHKQYKAMNNKHSFHSNDKTQEHTLHLH